MQFLPPHPPTLCVRTLPHTRSLAPSLSLQCDIGTKQRYSGEQESADTRVRTPTPRAAGRCVHTDCGYGCGTCAQRYLPRGAPREVEIARGGRGGGSGLQDGAMANRCVFALSCHVSHHLCVVPPLQLPLADSQQPSSPPRLRGHLRAHLWFFFPANFLWLLLVEIRESQLSSILARTNN